MYLTSRNDYHIQACMTGIEIYLDGVRRNSNVISADDKEGYVEAFQAGESGNLLCDENGEPIMKRIHGTVEFQIKDDLNAADRAFVEAVLRGEFDGATAS